MNEADKAQAIEWYAVKGYSLETIAQHFEMSVETLKDNLRKGV
jgi:predicted DNA-binding protein YlxM (UPF0122 family)